MVADRGGGGGGGDLAESAVVSGSRVAVVADRREVAAGAEFEWPPIAAAAW